MSDKVSEVQDLISSSTGLEEKREENKKPIKMLYVYIGIGALVLILAVVSLFFLLSSSESKFEFYMGANLVQDDFEVSVEHNDETYTMQVEEGIGYFGETKGFVKLSLESDKYELESQSYALEDVVKVNLEEIEEESPQNVTIKLVEEGTLFSLPAQVNLSCQGSGYTQAIRINSGQSNFLKPIDCGTLYASVNVNGYRNVQNKQCSGSECIIEMQKEGESPEEKTYNNLTVLVYDTQGNLLDNVKLSLSKSTLSTAYEDTSLDGSGYFEDVEVGTYTLTAEHPYGAYKTKQVVVSAGNPIETTITLDLITDTGINLKVVTDDMNDCIYSAVIDSEDGNTSTKNGLECSENYFIPLYDENTYNISIVPIGEYKYRYHSDIIEDFEISNYATDIVDKVIELDSFDFDEDVLVQVEVSLNDNPKEDIVVNLESVGRTIGEDVSDEDGLVEFIAKDGEDYVLKAKNDYLEGEEDFEAEIDSDHDGNSIFVQEEELELSYLPSDITLNVYDMNDCLEEVDIYLITDTSTVIEEGVDVSEGHSQIDFEGVAGENNYFRIQEAERKTGCSESYLDFVTPSIFLKGEEYIYNARMYREEDISSGKLAGLFKDPLGAESEDVLSTGSYYMIVDYYNDSDSVDIDDIGLADFREVYAPNNEIDNDELTSLFDDTIYSISVKIDVGVPSNYDPKDDSSRYRAGIEFGNDDFFYIYNERTRCTENVCLDSIVQGSYWPETAVVGSNDSVYLRGYDTNLNIIQGEINFTSDNKFELDSYIKGFDGVSFEDVEENSLFKFLQRFGRPVFTTTETINSTFSIIGESITKTFTARDKFDVELVAESFPKNRLSDFNFKIKEESGYKNYDINLKVINGSCKFKEDDKYVEEIVIGGVSQNYYTELKTYNDSTCRLSFKKRGYVTRTKELIIDESAIARAKLNHIDIYMPDESYYNPADPEERYDLNIDLNVANITGDLIEFNSIEYDTTVLEYYDSEENLEFSYSFIDTNFYPQDASVKLNLKINKINEYGAYPVKFKLITTDEAEVVVPAIIYLHKTINGERVNCDINTNVINLDDETINTVSRYDGEQKVEGRLSIDNLSNSLCSADDQNLDSYVIRIYGENGTGNDSKVLVAADIENAGYINKFSETNLEYEYILTNTLLDMNYTFGSNDKEGKILFEVVPKVDDDELNIYGPRVYNYSNEEELEEAYRFALDRENYPNTATLDFSIFSDCITLNERHASYFSDRDLDTRFRNVYTSPWTLKLTKSSNCTITSYGVNKIRNGNFENMLSGNQLDREEVDIDLDFGANVIKVYYDFLSNGKEFSDVKYLYLNKYNEDYETDGWKIIDPYVYSIGSAVNYHNGVYGEVTKEENICTFGERCYNKILPDYRTIQGDRDSCIFGGVTGIDFKITIEPYCKEYYCGKSGINYYFYETMFFKNDYIESWYEDIVDAGKYTSNHYSKFESALPSVLYKMPYDGAEPQGYGTSVTGDELSYHEENTYPQNEEGALHKYNVERNKLRMFADYLIFAYDKEENTIYINDKICIENGVPQMNVEPSNCSGTSKRYPDIISLVEGLKNSTLCYKTDMHGNEYIYHNVNNSLLSMVESSGNAIGSGATSQGETLSDDAPNNNGFIGASTTVQDYEQNNNSNAQGSNPSVGDELNEDNLYDGEYGI